MQSRWPVSAAVLLALLGFVVLGGSCRGDTSPNEILQDPDKFHGKTVTIIGTITGLRTTVSRRGNPYYTYDLHAGNDAIRVFSFGKPVCDEGGTVTVEGRFTKIKRVSGRTFYNEVEAKATRCK